MSFSVASALRKSTGRAKSDVANKLVSMFLHEMSRKACLAIGLSVSDSRYADSVVRAFGGDCLYCGVALTPSVVPVVEHLNGMNRFSVGLHVPGNVAIACKSCNNKKRDDDQKLPLSENGWESFLLHDGSSCPQKCRTCEYWRGFLPEADLRMETLSSRRMKIIEFQKPYTDFLEWSSLVRGTLREKIEVLYRDCQRFATQEIEKLAEDVDMESNRLDLPPT
jgi:hypothetical protein